MSLTNTRETYGWVSICLHWIAAIGVIAMLATGIQAWLAEQAHNDDARKAAMGLHVSMGTTLFALLAARVLAHYAQPQPDKIGDARLLNTVAAAVQHILLLAILIQIVSGPLAVWSGGRDLHAFDLFTVPTPFAERNEAVHEGAEIAHGIGRLLILAALPLHVLGALKRLVLDRDGSFQRMLRPK